MSSSKYVLTRDDLKLGPSLYLLTSSTLPSTGYLEDSGIIYVHISEAVPNLNELRSGKFTNIIDGSDSVLTSNSFIEGTADDGITKYLHLDTSLYVFNKDTVLNGISYSKGIYGFYTSKDTRFKELYIPHCLVGATSINESLIDVAENDLSSILKEVLV